jgi:hypothetical protein
MKLQFFDSCGTFKVRRQVPDGIFRSLDRPPRIFSDSVSFEQGRINEKHS